ncbi:MAG: hypothetical protein CMI58_02930 [Parcubacteria group bacterium]|jgi:dTDP-4-amino-4,6-dideoxygalactose transaminase|nr:hypothetical protein [Parcubacteria group bacterium]
MSEKLALFGGPPVRSGQYYPNKLGDEEKQIAVSVLESGILSGFAADANEQFYGGKYVKELESLFCQRFSCKYAVTFNSATSGLHGSMIAAGIGPGDEVIVPPYSMSATATAVLMCHAVPVFVDVEPDMFCINTDLIESFITTRTKAIIPVNLFGLPSDMDPILKIAEKHNLIVVEDNAQTPGAFYKGRLAGTIGCMGVFSLNRHKNIQCGEGGVVLTNDKYFAERLQLTRNHGEVVLFSMGRNDHADVVGYNYRLSELHAAVAIGQLKKLDEFNNVRVSLANHLTERLKEIPFMTSPKVRKDCTHVYYRYPMLYDRNKLGISRDTMVKALQSEGIHVSNYVAPIYMSPIYQKHKYSESDNFKRRFPEYNGTVNYSLGINPVVETLYKEKMIYTNICMPPNSKKEIDELLDALKKIELNLDALINNEKGLE